MTLVGLISDTHGLLRREAVAALRGVAQILHLGDIGRPDILDQLRDIAPVTAVRGNVDTEVWAQALPVDAHLCIAGFDLYMLHNLWDMAIDPEAAGISVIAFGHTHKPLVDRRDNFLLVNPGSAGPRRFSLPISVGFLRLSENAPAEAWVETLDIAR